MLTCVIGETTINLLDTKYDRFQLKKWSNKNILKCPVCKGEYEYCHGEINDPYFRHKNKECLKYFSESETNEHIKGKQLLYNWIKQQKGVTNVKLEYWIPETKQRPDIYFEKDNKKYVIEYQCTPIASELILRKELYALNNINDIWIMGVEKYDCLGFKGELQKTKGRKFIEKFSDFHLDSTNSLFLFDGNSIKLLKELSIERKKYDWRFYEYYLINHINDFLFKDGKVFLSQEMLDIYEQNFNLEIEKEIEKENFKNKNIHLSKNLIDYFEKIKNNYGKCEIKYSTYSYKKAFLFYKKINQAICLFFKNYTIDVREYNNGEYKNITSFSYANCDSYESASIYLKNYIDNYLNSKQEDLFIENKK